MDISMEKLRVVNSGSLNTYIDTGAVDKYVPSLWSAKTGSRNIKLVLGILLAC